MNTILIVEDNTPILEELTDILTHENYKVVTAQNGTEALEHIQHKQTDLIISDYRMPKMNGLDFLKTIKSKTDTSHIPIILLSARAEKEFVKKAIQLGASDYLIIPISIEKLINTIKKTIS